MNSFAAFSHTCVAFVATYSVHSTLLLATCWLVCALTRPKSHFLTERLWKSAAVLGVLTAFSQSVVGPHLLTEAVLSSAEKPADVEAHSDPESQEHRDAADRAAVAMLDVASDPHLQSADAVRIAHAPGGALPVNDAGLVEERCLPPPLNTAELTPLGQHSLSSSAELLDSTPVYLTKRSAVPAPSPARQVSRAMNSAQSARHWWPVVLQGSASVMVCGFVAGGLLLVVQTTRLRLRFGGARLLRKGIARTALDRFVNRHQIRRRIRLLASDKYCEPVAYGLCSWTIVLPEGAEDRLARNELQALLAHEVAHLVRGDVRWMWIGRVLCACCAFQPLNFLARRRWQQAAEYLCDDWALERGVRSLSLARCLTRVAEWRFGIETPEVGLAAGGSKATLVQRVTRLVDEHSTHDVWQSPGYRRLLVLSAALVSVAIVAFAPRVAFPQPAAGQRVSKGIVASRERSIEESTPREWLAVEEELFQLEADLQRAGQLAGENHCAQVASHVHNLNRRAAKLQARREHITSLLERESQR